MDTTRIARHELFQRKPTWAVAAIIAEEHIDDSDLMTDYHNHKTGRTVFLGWSRHERDLFPEMRQAAARFAETAHLGPGCNIFRARVEIASPDVLYSNGGTYYKGSPSHWHSEIEPPTAFSRYAEAQAWIDAHPLGDHDRSLFDDDKLMTFAWNITEKSIEHREKYSMGSGFYLKAGFSDGDGWAVKKRGAWWVKKLASETGDIEVATVPLTTETLDHKPAATLDGVTLTENTERHGIELRFPAKPDDAVRERLKADGWRWSRFSSCWYHRDTPEARESAQGFLS